MHILLPQVPPLWMYHSSKFSKSIMCAVAPLPKNSTFSSAAVSFTPFFSETLAYSCLHMPHNVSQLLKTPHHDANVFRHQLLCQDESAKDILESFNELTSSNEDTQVTQVKMCACLGVCISVFSYYMRMHLCLF